MNPRLEFTKRTQIIAWNRSGGICECHRVPMLKRPNGCGKKLLTGRVRYEHITPAEMAGDNSVENCAVLDIACWREKTDTYDLPVIAKSNRQRAKHIGARTKSRRSFATNKDGKFKRKMDGTIVRRANAAPSSPAGRW